MGIRGRGKFGLEILWIDGVRDTEWFQTKTFRDHAYKSYRKLVNKTVSSVKRKNR